jgi:hypothetical protein
MDMLDILFDQSSHSYQNQHYKVDKGIQKRDYSYLLYIKNKKFDREAMYHSLVNMVDKEIQNQNYNKIMDKKNMRIEQLILGYLFRWDMVGKELGHLSHSNFLDKYPGVELVSVLELVLLELV